MKTEDRDETGNADSSKRLLSETERQILEAVRSIRYGSVEVVIQDGKVAQIERKEKIRLK